MTLAWPPRNREFGFVDALGLVGLLGLLTARFVPVAALPFWSCTLRRTTGWPCPGCGLTRAAEALAHGDLPRAFTANPLGALSGCLLVACLLASLAHLVFAVPIPRPTFSRSEARACRIGLGALFFASYAFVIWRVRFAT